MAETCGLPLLLLPKLASPHMTSPANPITPHPRASSHYLLPGFYTIPSSIFNLSISFPAPT